MRKSVLTDDLDHCIVCGREAVNMHHIFFGINRKNADADGYMIPLCYWHHMGPTGIHFNKELELQWKREGQKHFEASHTRKEFIKRYGRNYLDGSK